MSKGRKLTQQQRDQLTGLKRWSKGVNQELAWQSVSGGQIFYRSTDGIKYYDYPSGMTPEDIGKLKKIWPKDTLVEEEPKETDTRTETEKWADEWATEHGARDGGSDIPSGTDTNSRTTGTLATASSVLGG